MNPHPLRRLSVPKFWWLLEILSILICCLLDFHQAEISIVKRLIQWRYNITRVRVEPKVLHLLDLAVITAPFKTFDPEVISHILFIHNLSFFSQLATGLLRNPSHTNHCCLIAKTSAWPRLRRDWPRKDTKKTKWLPLLTTTGMCKAKTFFHSSMLVLLFDSVKANR